MKARKKPVEIECIQRTDSNDKEILDFCGKDNLYFVRIVNGDPDGNEIWNLYIRTLEGDHKVDCTDYIIKGVNGEFYPCKEDIFHKTYDIIEE